MRYTTNTTGTFSTTLPANSPDLIISNDGTSSFTVAFQEAPVPLQWEAVMALEGVPTDDGRLLMREEIEWRELPLTLMAQTVNAEGHLGSEVAGRIEEIWREDRDDLGDGAVAIMGRGVFDDSEFGRNVARLVDDQTLRGVSIDMAASEVVLLNAETLEPIDEADMDMMEMLLGGDHLTGMKGVIMGATVVPFPAFSQAFVRVIGGDEHRVLVASGYGLRLRREALTAAAARLAPLHPPHDWFYTPEPNGPCPLTVTDDGQVYGHLALWNQCHRSFTRSCELAPHSPSGYRYFHLGELRTNDGRVPVGCITVGDKGHAPLGYNADETRRHYDETGLVAAYVRASDGRHGIWLSGAVRSDCPAERVRDLMAHPPSGDWRTENGQLELVAALAVPVQGFPVPRVEAALVASGDEEQMTALVASGYQAAPKLTRAQKRKVAMLADTFRDYPAAERRRMARNGQALPDGSFPIKDCADAEDAIRSIGRAGDRDAAEAHIRKRVRALGCEGDMFEDWE